MLSSGLWLIAAAFGFVIMAMAYAAVIKIVFFVVPVVFMVSLVIGLGARNWGRCL